MLGAVLPVPAPLLTLAHTAHQDPSQFTLPPSSNQPIIIILSIDEPPISKLSKPRAAVGDIVKLLASVASI